MARLPPPASRRLLRERYDQRQLVVVAHAARQFAHRGFHATSVQQLATATGLTSGGLYHYFGSKDDLLVRICDDLMQPILSEVRAIVATDAPADVHLRAIVRAWLLHVKDHRYHMLVFQQERHVLRHGAQWRSVRQQRKDFEDLLAAVLARGTRTGTFRFPDLDLAAKALLGMVNHTAQWYRPDGRLGAEQIADGYVDLLLAGG